MGFISFSFIIFLVLVFTAYWSCSNLRLQKIILLVSGYIFYGSWSWKFLLILVGVSLVNFMTGAAIGKTSGTAKKIWLVIGLLVNIGVLACFKYFNFFIDGLADLFSLFSVTLQRPVLSILLPVGISFYIFLSISYIVDIYRNKLRGDNDLPDVLLTLGFFPVLLAGPIQRPVTLLPQIQKKKIFNYSLATDGLRQILWGLFMKVLIADNCAVYVNDIFANYNLYSGSTLLFGGIFYSVQIYADFAGYSEMAIGISKLFGFELMTNFSYPYFAGNITEFWRRWHISLTSWFRDYLFLPVAYYFSGKIPGAKFLFIKSELFIYMISIAITWILTGLWHGSNYTFIVWGVVHGSCLIIYQVFKQGRKSVRKALQSLGIGWVFSTSERFIMVFVIIIAWIIFRSEDIASAGTYLHRMFSSSLFSLPSVFPEIKNLLIILFFLIEWIQRKRRFTLDIDEQRINRPVRWMIYYALFFLVFWLGGDQQQFIYFQF